MGNYFKHKMRGKNPGVIAAMILMGIIVIGGLAVLFGFIILWLWNWLMPDLFGLPEITYWQGVGIFILAKILFGMGGSGGSKSKNNSDDWSCDDSKSKKKKDDWSKWKHYDRFWKEEGNQAYEAYLMKLEGGEIEPEKPEE